MRAKTDEQLIQCLNEGRSEALDELYRRYARSVYAFCAVNMSSPIPEDMVHDVFMRVIEGSRRFDESKGSFRAWLFRIARNRCIDLMRRDRKIRFVPFDADRGAAPEDGVPLDTIADERPGAEEAAIRSAAVEALRGCLEELPHEDDRQAIVLFYLMDKVYREIGAALGKSTSMAQKRVKSARERLKRCLERKGVAA